MSAERPLLVIVPARGGSKAIPFKNMRSVGGRPLIAYTVDAIQQAGVGDRIVISSDSDQILLWAELHGHEGRMRPSELATDDATISAVAAHLADELDWIGDVGVFQPTSPLRSVESIVAAVRAFREFDGDSLASAVRERHLMWLDVEDDLTRATPLFEARLNRQAVKHRVMRETGSIQLVRAEVLRSGREMVTDRHMLFELSEEESLDIDTPADLAQARRVVEQSTVIFRLSANATVGSGHLFHCLQLADELSDQRLRFLLRACEPFVSQLLDEHNFSYREETDLRADLGALSGSGPNLVVNDILDTTEADILVERTLGMKVVNIEDLGPGSRFADWVVNALYPVQNGAGANVACGPRYATLRGEFHDIPPKQIRDTPHRVLITFGGTDPARLAARCARLLNGHVATEVHVIVGPGATTEGFPEGVMVRRHVRSMAAEMMAADLVLTSAGRTVYEAAATSTPVVVLAQNAREATHSHLSYEEGVVFLGIGALVTDEQVRGVVERLLSASSLRNELSQRLARSIDERGAARIAHRIRGLVKGLED
jgi:CMP-N-acetylneuraminic acid synthetase/spore coat polysaccharide biosynthesis predicted glycosyltransferase SpsG